MTRERLKLVTDFAELRAGMIVVYRPCLICKKAHRGILLSEMPGFDGPGFPMLPPPACRERWCAEWWGPGRETVAKRKVWRVIDAAEDGAKTTTAKPKRRETVR